MGWQGVTYYSFGMILSPNDTPHEDVLLGLQLVASERIHKTPTTPSYIRRALTRPSVWWIGCDVGSPFVVNGLPKLPSQAPLRAWIATDPYVAREAAYASPSLVDLSKAKAEWSKFEQWCFERGVDIRGRGQLLIVNDYD